MNLELSDQQASLRDRVRAFVDAEIRPVAHDWERAGRYPTETICKVVRQHGMISLEEAHWRLAALPAQVAGFTGRGQLIKGAPADIVVYDYDNLKVLPDEIVHDLPGGEWRRVQRASGYKYVLINGQVTIKDDQQTNTFSGELLRHGLGRRTNQAIAAE